MNWNDFWPGASIIFGVLAFFAAAAGFALTILYWKYQIKVAAAVSLATQLLELIQ